MISPNQKSHSSCDSTVFTHRSEQQRLDALHASGLVDVDRVPVFDEATQTAAHFLSMPICLLGVIDSDRHWFKSAVGLSRIGLMNELAVSRQLPRVESLCDRVVELQRPVVIADVTLDPTANSSLLVQRYGIRAYLGVPLFTSQGQCLGSLAVMELAPRQFSPKDIAFLELMARWSMSEYERDRLLHRQDSGTPIFPTTPAIARPEAPASLSLQQEILEIKSNLLTQMTQELRTPLTSVLGMTSVLKREIYGTLTPKQHEYVDVVHNSGQYLLSLANEILEIGSLETDHSALDLTPVDVEMVCQQAIRSLDQAAHRCEDEIQLTVEPGNRIWYLDKAKIRQMLYHLTSNLIQSSNPGSTVRIHVSRKQQQLHIMLWTSHPWLGEGLPQDSLPMNDVLSHPSMLVSDTAFANSRESRERHGNPGDADMVDDTGEAQGNAPSSDRHQLGLKLSQRLAALHGGEIKTQGSPTTGGHYVVILPQLQPDVNALNR
ncbi:MAG: GAF domain-containing sensor histidine kinase [Synechococcales cyanobacterium T60_A2020_003]|nr:GAF domain-containing sensor histidine kinase [Synechococcales cyanobacterium T60_A2020_003]